MFKYDINTAIKIINQHYKTQLDLLPKEENILHYMQHKIKHSYGVLQTSYRIISKTKTLNNLEEKIKEKMTFAALLHDLGRFSQHNGKRILKNSEADHGLLSYEVMKHFGITDAGILLSAKYHNKVISDLTNIQNDEDYINLSTEEKKEAELIIKLVRDADKIENIEYFTYSKFGIIKSFSGWIGIGYKNNTINTNLIDNLIEGKNVKYPQDNSYLDDIILSISWINDINYEGSKEIIKHSGLFEVSLEILQENGVDYRIDDIKKYFNEY